MTIRIVPSAKSPTTNSENSSADFYPGTESRELTENQKTERAGFDLPSLCKVLNSMVLPLNPNDSKDLESLVDLLFLYEFLLSRDVF